MDYHALQQKLFALDPSDPAEDLRKLRESAGNNVQKSAEDTKDYVQESVQVQEGSLEMDRDYSVSDFAALAGVTLNEAQKTGSAGQAKGKDPMPKTSKPSSTGEQPHPLKDKLVGEADIEEGFKDAFNKGKADYNKLSALSTAKDDLLDKPATSDSKDTSDNTGAKDTPKQDSKAPTTLNQLSQGDSFKDAKGMVWYYNPNKKNWMSKDRRQIISSEEGFKRWMQSASQRKRSTRESQIEALESRIAYLEDVIETLIEAKDERKIKPRDPNSEYMQNLRRSGASGVHQDQNKKKQTPRKAKHKNKQYESIKEELWAKLNAAGKS